MKAGLLALAVALGACRPPETDVPGFVSDPAGPPPAVRDEALGRPTYKDFMGNVREVGTAFLFLWEGGTYVATAHHVVAGGDEDVQLTRRGAFVASGHKARKPRWARAARPEDSKTDVEVFEARALSAHARPLELAPGPPVRGRRVWLLYFPRPAPASPARDFELRGALVTRSSDRRLEARFDGNPDCAGASGAPVLDAQARVVGLLTRCRGDGQETFGLATPLESLKALLR